MTRRSEVHAGIEGIKYYSSYKCGILVCIGQGQILLAGAINHGGFEN